MSKRNLTIFLLLAIALGIIVCGIYLGILKGNNSPAIAPDSSAVTNQIVQPKPPEGQEEITIVVFEGDCFNEIVQSYAADFKKKYGVKVNIDQIENTCEVLLKEGNATISFTDEKSVEDFYAKLSSKLYIKDGPELIFYNNFPLDHLIKQNAVLNVRGRLTNLTKIYDKLLDEEVYYVPLALYYNAKILNKSIVDSLGIEQQGLEWTKDDYEKVRTKWLEKYSIPFTSIIFDELVNDKLTDVCREAIHSKKISLNNLEFKEWIKIIREDIFSGRYKLDSSYTYKNYYNLLNEIRSEEFRQEITTLMSGDYHRNSLQHENYVNLLKAECIYEANMNAIVMPEFKDRITYLDSWGFLVNRNGKNIELALEFIDNFLNDETQLNQYEKWSTYYPVNKDIEESIKEIEAKSKFDNRIYELKKNALKEIKTGKARLGILISEKENQIFEMLKRDSIKLILADETLSDERLSKELETLEHKYYIYLNE